MSLYSEYDIIVHVVTVLITIIFIHEHPYSMCSFESGVEVCAGGGANDV